MVKVEVLRAGNRPCLIMDTPGSFSLEVKSAADSGNSEVQVWQRLTLRFQRASPRTRPGLKWAPMQRMLSLGHRNAATASVPAEAAVQRNPYVNGIEVRASEGYDVPRTYPVPAGVLRAGRNVIAIGSFGGAGLLSPAERLSLRLAGGTVLPLSGRWRFKCSASMRRTGQIPHVPWLNQFGLTDLYVGGDEEPRGSGGERRFSEGPPGAGGDAGAYGPTTAARRSRSGIKKLFDELKRETCGTSNQRARKSRKRVDHQKEADFNPHQQICTTA